LGKSTLAHEEDSLRALRPDRQRGEPLRVQATVATSYTDFSDDGVYVLNGTENVTTRNSTPTTNHVDWYPDLVQTGCATGTKTTSADGFHLTIDVLTNIFEATGTMTTTIDGHTYHQPANRT
jgi:hypothetical protein